MRRIVIGVTGVSAVSICLAAIAMLTGVFTPRTPATADAAAPACAGRVLSDWVDDGRVQGTYRLQCYRAAIKALPEDLRAYSTAPDDLTRAMQSRRP